MMSAPRFLLALALAGVIAVSISAQHTQGTRINLRNLGQQSASSTGAQVSSALVGANFTHHSLVDGCSLSGTGIVATYHERNIRERVRAQLNQMRTNGLQSLRVIVWHQPGPVTHPSWGVFATKDGEIPEPYRTNLMQYVADVRLAGFQRLTVALAPQGTANPRSHNFSSTDADANWRTIKDVRSIVEDHGTPEFAIDLLNEGPAGLREPPETRARVQDYLRDVFDRYTRTWGNDDVTVSFIASQAVPDTIARLTSLLHAVYSAGGDRLRWFDLHPGYDPVLAAANLKAVDQFLVDRRLRQPIVISESAYGSRAVARAIAQTSIGLRRPVREVLVWPLTRDKPCLDISVEPPYEALTYSTQFNAR